MEKTFLDAYMQTVAPSRISVIKGFFEKGKTATPEKQVALIKDSLNIALIDEWLAELNYFSSWNLSRTDGKTDFDPEFKQHEEEERDHRYKIINRLRELDCISPNVPLYEFQKFNSQGEKWHQEFSTNSTELLLRRLQEEEDAVDFYGAFIEFLKHTEDSTTLKLIREIKADEEQHVLDLRDLAREREILDLKLEKELEDANNEE